MCAAQSMYAPIIAIGESPAVKRAVAACTERSTTSANAVAAYESRMNDGSGGAKPGPGAGFVGTAAGTARKAPRRRGRGVAAFAAGIVEREGGKVRCASMAGPRARENAVWTSIVDRSPDGRLTRVRDCPRRVCGNAPDQCTGWKT